MKFKWNIVVGTIFLLIYLVLRNGIIVVAGEPNDVFYVVHTKGTFVVKKTQQSVKVGDVLKPGMKLIPKTTEAIVIAISPVQGRKTLKTPRSKDKQPAEWIEFAANMWLSGHKYAGDRSVFDEIESGNPYLILDTVAISVDPDTYPVNDTAWFYVRYTYRGETVNKPLPFEYNTLLIRREAIYTMNGERISEDDVSDMTLFYYVTQDGETPVSIKIGDFQPIFPNNEQLQAEITVLLNVLKSSNTPEEDIEKEILGFLLESYGTPFPDNVRQWLRQHFPEE